MYALLENATRRLSRRYLGHGNIEDLFQYQKRTKRNIIEKERFFANQEFSLWTYAAICRRKDADPIENGRSNARAKG